MTAATTLSDTARLRLALLRLGRRLRQRGDPGVTPSQLSALATVRRRGPLRLGALAHAERIGRSTLTRIVAALDDAGLLRREPDPADARCALVSITEAGEQLLERYRQRADAYLAQQFAALSPSERDVLTTALPVLERLLEEEA